MKRVFSAFPVRFMQVGEKGDKGDKGDTGAQGDKGDKGDKGDAGKDSVTLYVAEPVVTVQTDDAGYPLEIVANKDIPCLMYKGGMLVSDAIVSTINGATAVQTLGGIRVERNGNNLRYTYTKANAVSPLVCTIAVTSPSLAVTLEGVVSFAVARQGVKGETGAQGIQGMQGKTMRRRGDYTNTLSTTNDTIYNNSSWMDWIIYDGKKYRLRDNVLSWTRAMVVLSDNTTVNGTYPPHSSSPYWEEFSELRDAAFSFIIARGLDVDNASICEAFIGTTGATANDDETVSLASGANGWAITGGQIRHTKTGLTLTADGCISDPDGLHMKVGGEQVRRNLLPNAYFDKTAGITFPSGAWSQVNAALQYGKNCIMIGIAGGQSGTEYVTNDILMATVGKRVKLTKNKTYTFSYVGKTGQTGIDGGCGAKIKLYSAETGGTASTTYSLPSILEADKLTRKTISFSSGSTDVYLDFVLGVKGVGSSVNYYFDAVKLEEGSSASAMSDSEQADLLATGIDIEQGKIVNTANQWECRNNKGEKTAWLDSVGNFTVAGVYNNLVTEINSSNISQYGCRRYDLGTYLFYLDPLRCPAVIYLNASDISKVILPVAYSSVDSSAPSTEIEGYKAGDSSEPTSFSLTEMRQCISKRIWLMKPDRRIIIQTGGDVDSTSPSLLMKKNVQYNGTVDLAEVTTQSQLLVTVEMMHYFNSSDNGFRNYVLECKMGIFNGCECIYWELTSAGVRLP